MLTRFGTLLAIGVAALAIVATAGAGAGAWYSNCKALNARYPHGVGKVGARDITKSGDPVTNFKRSSVLYRLATSHNKRLDADHDGVACEKK
jgi:excalibur calcium-binding domain-containing protein